MKRRRWIAPAALLLGAWLGGAPAAEAQFFGGNAATSGSGVGMIAVPSTNGITGGIGLMAVPMATAAAGQTGKGATLAGTSADPLGMSYVYGPTMPMTPGQAGLFMLSTQQRMLGLGNGVRSGVRPGPSAAGDAAAARGGRGGVEASSLPVASHTRNSNRPGGQASQFFNRGEVAVSRPRPYYNRSIRQAPQSSR